MVGGDIGVRRRRPGVADGRVLRTAGWCGRPGGADGGGAGSGRSLRAGAAERGDAVLTSDGADIAAVSKVSPGLVLVYV